MRFIVLVLLGVFGGAPWAQADCSLVFNGLRLGFLRPLPKAIRVMTFNTQQLKITHEPSPEDLDIENRKFTSISKTIKDIKPDVAVLQEVQSAKALNRLAIGELQNKYEAIYLPGAYPKEGGISFLIRRELPVFIEVRSHKHKTWYDPARWEVRSLFGRDLPALIVRSARGEKPLFVVLGHHAKAMIDRPGDPGSRKLRTAQHEGALEILADLEREFGSDVPLLFAGDFNADLRTAPEVQVLKKKMKTVFEVDPKAGDPNAHVTHTLHRGDGPRQESQLDGILVNQPLWKRVVNSFVYYFKSKSGKPKPLPESYEQRQSRPSDHLPVVTEFILEPAA